MLWVGSICGLFDWNSVISTKICVQTKSHLNLVRIEHELTMIFHDNLCLSLANLQKNIEVKRSFGFQFHRQ